ncbi:uncharacterized protein A4U43_C07F5660 [Asparagus officinalis]|uniref:Protein CHUP1, chloroplastic n=1 Tax=Asparagus officinalis TaxID=4686 RepID=A0A5P1EBL9_ASPOF|nr:protein CHUP1, chloroplastic [Asparagus officinalis]ONK62587.1 uncharacterized protein A4U43_C07F5660 [Asparagus officinalis]
MNKMLEEEDIKSVFILRDRLSYLEKENESLKQEVLHLKRQIVLLQAQESNKRSVPKTKVNTSINNNGSSQEKQIVAIESSFSRREFPVSLAKTKDRMSRVPKPPPTPSNCLLTEQIASDKEAKLPPPPPPPPSKLRGLSKNSVKRVPEVIDLYRAMTKRDSKQERRTGGLGIQVVQNAREMIGEIENRSSYLSAIKSDVETQGEFINLLKNEVENASFREMKDVEAFVKWLDEELSYLVDERAVLKHFPQWPEKKADAMREAACSYRDLKNLESEVASFHDDLHQSVYVSLKCIQTLQDKLERSVHSFERARESAMRRYRNFKIPWEWMLNTGIINQLKLCSMKLAKLHINRVLTAIELNESSENEDLMLQGVRFAFRVHQFVGGFDEECKHAFQELKKIGEQFCL